MVNHPTFRISWYGQSPYFQNLLVWSIILLSESPGMVNHITFRIPWYGQSYYFRNPLLCLCPCLPDSHWWCTKCILQVSCSQKPVNPRKFHTCRPSLNNSNTHQTTWWFWRHIVIIFSFSRSEQTFTKHQTTTPGNNVHVHINIHLSNKYIYVF